MAVDFDKFGYCVFCHKYLMEEKVMEGEVQLVFTKDRKETVFMLDDGSQMRVCICKGCKENLKESDHNVIMQSVVKGWEKEVESLVHWTEDQRIDHMVKYSKKKILFKSEGMKEKEAKEKFKKVKKEKK